MQNNRRGDLKAQSSKLAGQRPTNSTVNIPRVYPEARVYPNTNADNTKRGYVTQNTVRYTSAQNAARNAADMSVSSPTSRIYPVKLPDSRKKPLKPAKKYSKLFDFLLGLGIGLIVFGTAAVFVCRALINIFAL